MSPTFRNVVYPVSDMARAKPVYQALLGVEPYVDMPYYTGFRAGEIELGLTPRAPEPAPGVPVDYWAVEDIAAALRAVTEAGAKVRQEPQDVGQGLLVAVVEDQDGNLTGLRQEPR